MRVVADGSFNIDYNVYGAIYVREEPTVDTSVTGVNKTG